MKPGDLLAILERHGAVLLLDGDRLRLRAPEGFPDDLRAKAKAHKTDLIALLADRRRRQTPREHFLSLADGFEDQGIVGHLGSIVTGDLWQAVQQWEHAARRNRPEAGAFEQAYWALWERHFPARHGGDQ